MLTAVALALIAASPSTQTTASGLWIGEIAVCRDSAETVKAAYDATTLEPVVTISLHPQWHEALRRETERRLDQPMPIRLDGRLIAEPIVREAIIGGKLQFGPVAEADAEALRAAAARPCP